MTAIGTLKLQVLRCQILLTERGRAIAARGVDKSDGIVETSSGMSSGAGTGRTSSDGSNELTVEDETYEDSCWDDRDSDDSVIREGDSVVLDKVKSEAVGGVLEEMSDSADSTGSTGSADSVTGMGGRGGDNLWTGVTGGRDVNREGVSNTVSGIVVSRSGEDIADPVGRRMEVS